MVYRAEKKVNKLFVIVLVIVVLCSCLLIDSVVAWLTQKQTIEENRLDIGSIDVRLYANGVEVQGVENEGEIIYTAPYQISGGNVNRSNIDLKLRNMGNIKALVRANIEIYYLDDNLNRRTAVLTTTTPTQEGVVQAEINDELWLTDFPRDTVAGGYMYFNTSMPSYTNRVFDGTGINETTTTYEYKLVDSLTVSTAQRTTNFYISVSINAVAFDGNIYKKIKEATDAGTALGDIPVKDIPVWAYPFGTNLPEEWTAPYIG